MNSPLRTTFAILVGALIVGALLLTSGAAGARPWSSVAAPGQKAALSHAAADETTVETWVLVAIIVIGFGVLTVRMLRYRREMEKSILRRMRQEWVEGRALLETGRSFLREQFDSENHELPARHPGTGQARA